MIKIETILWTLFITTGLTINGHKVTNTTSKGQEGLENKKLICFLNGTSEYRHKSVRFSIFDINPYLCTHVIYEAVEINKRHLISIKGSKKTEEDKYALLNNLKKYHKNLKTLVYAYITHKNHLDLVTNEASRKALPKAVVQFLRLHNFDGIDLRHEFSRFFENRSRHELILKDLKEEFENEAIFSEKPKLLLTMSLPAGFSKKLELKKMVEHLDWLHVKCFEYMDGFEKFVSHHSPLYTSPGYPRGVLDAHSTVDYTVRYLRNRGVPPSKLIMGLPTFGITSTLVSPQITDIGSLATGVGTVSDNTILPEGWIAFFEICKQTNAKGWSVVHANKTSMGPYAFHDNQWMSFDDVDSIKAKTKYAMDKELGGVIFFYLDTDDFSGACYKKPFPLVEAARETLLSYRSPAESSPTAPAAPSKGPPTSSKSCTMPVDNVVRFSVTCNCSESKKTIPSGCKIEATCKDGYAVETGDLLSAICSDGQWFPAVPRCSRICQTPDSENVDLICYKGRLEIDCNERLLTGTRVSVSCKQNYHPEYPVTRTEVQCKGNGEWDYPLFNCVPDCGKASKVPTLLISGGKEEPYGESPWHVAIYDLTGGKNILICGGTIISPRIVVSAAHCFFDRVTLTKSNASRYEIAVSKVSRNYSNVDNPFQRMYKIKEIIFPDKEFHGIGTAYVSDIALLILKEKILLSDVVLPACIDLTANAFAPEDGTQGKVVGWGFDDSNFSKILLAANLPFISYSTCIKIIPEEFKSYVTLDKFCAGSVKGPGVREGDSGGGLLFQDPQQSLYYLRGVVSLKPSADISISMFTDISQHINWIKKTLNNAEKDIMYQYHMRNH